MWWIPPAVRDCDYWAYHERFRPKTNRYSGVHVFSSRRVLRAIHIIRHIKQMQSHVTAGSVTIGYRELQHLFAARIEQALSRFFFARPLINVLHSHILFIRVCRACILSILSFPSKSLAFVPKAREEVVGILTSFEFL